MNNPNIFIFFRYLTKHDLDAALSKMPSPDEFISLKEVKKLKQILKDLQEEEKAIEPQLEPTFNGTTKMALQDMLNRADGPFSAVHMCMINLFTREEIITHTPSGKPSNSKSAPPPKFNPIKYGLMEELVKTKYPELKSCHITAVNAVKKKIAPKEKQ